MIALFQIPYKVSLKTPPVQLICQSLMAGREIVLWVDGLNSLDPVVIPISSVASTRMIGTYEDFLRQNLDLAEQVLSAGNGDLSPTLVARSVTYMKADSRLTAEAAIEMSTEQGVDILDADLYSAAHFWGKNGPQALHQEANAIA